ncbi:hypothetical protein DY000_02048827 [Brassica cretica]|uniref:Uncharacterized protein n=1 Tax=Brassica cretica TaxID=69181 RepID=A0ABQ7F9U5_BRACR|nr:hypothetical protein DY000_02048827 [Brassica cretica]
MEGSPYRKFSFSRRKGVVPGTGPGVLLSGDPGRLLAGTQRPVSYLGSGGILYLNIDNLLDVDPLEPIQLELDEEEDSAVYTWPVAL